MNAFISWSGSRGLLIAGAVREWLAAVAPELRPSISPNLEKGQPWFGALAKELKSAGIGFMCLAPPRVASDWQLVEAGAIWKAARGGRLYPLCFGIRKTDIPDPLRVFQVTHFDKVDFHRLAVDLAERTRQGPDWTAAQQVAFEQSWLRLEASVGDALRRPDDGVHTTRGFIHEIAGGWWERVKSEDGVARLSWMWFEPSADGAGQRITGRGFGAGGVDAARWQTDLVSVQAQLPEPTIEYYWEGRNIARSNLLFGGKGWFRFTIAADGAVREGTGEYRDVCLDQAAPPVTLLVDIRRATLAEVAIMTGMDEKVRRALVEGKLRDWP